MYKIFFPKSSSRLLDEAQFVGYGMTKAGVGKGVGSHGVLMSPSPSNPVQSPIGSNETTIMKQLERQVRSKDHEDF